MRNYFWISFLLGTCCITCNNDSQTDQNDRFNQEEGKESSIKTKSPDDLYPELYEAVQLSKIFDDSKTFADAIPIKSIDKINDAFNQLEDQRDVNKLKKIVETHFEIPKISGMDFQTQSNDLEGHIESLWPILTVTTPHSDAGNLIELPSPYIVSGGRFKELHYWDSYFTMLGLQVDGEISLIQNMVDNFAYLIDQYGCIPAGNRTYYLSRSQPPMFSLMVSLLAEEKGSTIFTKYLPQMRKEYFFWMDGMNQAMYPKNAHRRIVKMFDGKILNRYYDDKIAPRAESFAEDVKLRNDSKRDESIYTDIRAASESGWEFSSRWFDREVDIKTIRTSKVIPIDLNSILYQLEMTISKAYDLEGDSANAQVFLKNAFYRKEQINDKCWDNAAGYFMDYDWERNRKTGKPSLAGMYALFFRVATPAQANRAAEFLEKFMIKPGGAVTTMLNTDQQWDAPYGWAPLQWITIQGLRNYGIEEPALLIRDRWIRLVKNHFNRYGKLVEKYDVMNASLDAAGGTYPNQDGYGWTNGVLLKLLEE